MKLPKNINETLAAVVILGIAFFVVVFVQTRFQEKIDTITAETKITEERTFDTGYGFSFRYHGTMTVLPGFTGPDDFFVVPAKENKPDLQNAIVIMSTMDIWTPYAKDSPQAIGWEPIEIDGEYAEYNKREAWVIALTPEGRSLSISAPSQDEELQREMEYIVSTMRFERQ